MASCGASAFGEATEGQVEKVDCALADDAGEGISFEPRTDADEIGSMVVGIIWPTPCAVILAPEPGRPHVIAEKEMLEMVEVMAIWWLQLLKNRNLNECLVWWSWHSCQLHVLGLWA